MSGGKAFVDSNVLLYIPDEGLKADIAEKILVRGAVISVQVLNECASVAHAKWGMQWQEIRALLAGLRSRCNVMSINLEMHEEALAIADRYHYSFWDSLIVAAALQGGCETLYSEDLHDGQLIGSLTIVNPFKAAV